MKKVILLFMFLAVNLFVRAQQMKIGTKMPDFSLKSSVYGNVDSAGLKGKIVLVSLFATWCAPCQLELAEIQKKLWPKYGSNKDFSLIVIGREHTEEQLRIYNDKKNLLSLYIPTPKGKFIPCLRRIQYQELTFSIKKVN